VDYGLLMELVFPRAVCNIVVRNLPSMLTAVAKVGRVNWLRVSEYGNLHLLLLLMINSVWKNDVMKREGARE